MHEGRTHEEDFASNLQEGNFNLEGGNFSDGMEPINVPDRINKENYLALFPGGLNGLDPSILEDGELELEQ